MFLVRYGEIGLKGNKRREFENLLKRNIERKLRSHSLSGKVIIKQGRILVYSDFQASEILQKCPGIVSISPAEEMTYAAIFIYLKEKLGKFDVKTFRISAKRVNKNFEKSSMEMNTEIGDFVVENFGWKVNLENPELDIGVETIDSHAYVFFERISGVGGLPVDEKNKVISLLSGGIDSPVSTYLMMKRGTYPIILHFKRSDEEYEKVRKYVEILNEYSPFPLTLIVEDHAKYIEKIWEKLKEMGQEKWTCVFCKYIMLKRAQEVGEEKHALGIVTGDSLGQVASQTPENLYIISSATRMPVYRPLIGMDKVEIERIAKKIGTYKVFTSHKEMKCPFKPRYVITRGNYKKFLEIKEKLEI